MQRHRRKEERIALDSSDLLLATTIGETKLASKNLRFVSCPFISRRSSRTQPCVGPFLLRRDSRKRAASGSQPGSLACRAGHEEAHHLLSSQSRTLPETLCCGAAQLSYGLAIHLHKEAIPCISY